MKILEHRIPSANSAPYICVEGPDNNPWFCESGAATIGCFDPRKAAFKEFPLPAAARLIEASLRPSQFVEISSSGRRPLTRSS